MASSSARIDLASLAYDVVARFATDIRAGRLVVTVGQPPRGGRGLADPAPAERLFTPTLTRALATVPAGGVVELTLSPDEADGAVFSLDVLAPAAADALPVRPRTPIASDSVRAFPPTSPARSGVVLLVEDDASAREYGAAVLQDLGYRVLTARNGDDGLRVWAAHRNAIDVVLTDLLMPRRGGVAVYRAVHRDRPDVPLIVVSGFPHVAEMLDAGLEGVTEFLQKPVEPEDLAASVDRALRRARA